MAQSTGLRRAASLAVRTYRRWHQNTGTNARAEAARLAIEKGRGATPAEHLKAADEYANDVFQWRGYAPWLRAYTALRGKFVEGWIPDNFYQEVVTGALNARPGQVSTAKTFSNRIFASEMLPDLGYVIRGRFFDRAFEPVPPGRARQILFEQGNRVIFKVNASGQGRGIAVYARDAVDDATISSLRDGVFQAFIDQHPFFAGISPNSVATLRITSVMDRDGRPSVRAAYVRGGRTEDAYVRSDHQVRAEVDLATGRISAHAYLPDWKEVAAHPDTGFVFGSAGVIPAWPAIMAAVLQLHRSVPQVACIGWDVILDKEGNVKLMEWNADKNTIIFHEMVTGPCFADLGWPSLVRPLV
jgi:hypothetical protein